MGKPSAGKSTFFNAVTRATGAIAAKVAAYPFTTIDPNVREGLYGVLDPDPALALGRPLSGSPHGRDAQGRRLLPLLLKDVAGLVPGAYAGRGKGNQFLQDLTTADVLIHVVDVRSAPWFAGSSAHLPPILSASLVYARMPPDPCPSCGQMADGRSRGRR